MIKMFCKKLVDDVYSIGVLNPSMRVFDIVMKTEFGTSYNSYLIKGQEKTALIDTVHENFLDYFVSNIKNVGEVDKIDYLIMNHNEPDHSGSLEKMLDLMPDVTVVASQAGSIYLKNITNRQEMKVKVVKDGEVLDLGGKTLKFINAPFLHWPDSMFTYLEQDKILFSCDFLGAHFCEPQVLDTQISYMDNYVEAFKYYYDGIFGPFKPYVIKGLEKIQDLSIDMVAPSHGPVLTKGVLLEKNIEQYKEWSTPVVRENKLIPIFYCSAYGNTRNIAKQIQAGIQETLPAAEVQTYDIIKHDMAELGALLNASDAFLIGTPTINKDAVAPVHVLLSHVDAVNNQKKPTAVFGSYGWSGEGIPNVKSRLTNLKTNLYDGDCKVIFVPSQEDLEKAKEFGRDFAKMV